MHDKRYIKGRMAGLTILLAFTLAWVNLTSTASAQFSDTWEFFKALEERDYKEMRSRINRGANINGHNKEGLTAVIMAVRLRDLELLNFLIEQGVNVNGRTSERGETGLMRAAEIGSAETVRALLENGANPDREDRGGETPLIKAAKGRKRTVVKLLIEAGADLNQADFTGRTAIDYAREARARSVVKLLEDAGAEF